MISVVIPLFNKADSIEDTVNSVLRQTFEDFEIIVVDDGSEDLSTEVVLGIADDRVHLFKKTNGGVSSARNYGIMKAEGDIVAFLDADDIWAPNYLSEMNSMANEYPDAVIYGFGYAEMKEGIIHEKRLLPFRGVVSREWRFPFFYWTSATACRTYALREVGGFDERMTYGEDCDLWYRMLLYGNGVLDSRCMAFYNQDATSRLTDKEMPLEKHIPAFIDKYEKDRRENDFFRRFFDEQMVYRLYPYMFDREYRHEAKRLSRKLDYSQLKPTMKIRMQFPYAYRFFRRLIGH